MIDPDTVADGAAPLPASSGPEAFASTVAQSSGLHRAPPFDATLAVADGVAVAPATLRQTRPSVLPRVEPGEGDTLRLVHEPKERYRIGERLGVGGMGEALRADDMDIGRPVAIKRLLPEVATASGLARFVDEVRIVGSLDHPNVVPLHDVGLDAEGRYFFVMKYCDGQTLESVIERLAAADPAAHAEWPWERRVDVFLGLLRALEYAHSQGIVHRDVKPANVMVGRYGEVWLMDWGIAKRKDRAELAWTDEPSATLHPRAAARTTRHGAIIGSPAYMAPEQARGDHARVDARSDLYAACVLFHELLTTTHYLEHRMGSLAELLDAVQNETPRIVFHGIRARNGQGPVPAELLHFVARGLAKDPAARFQSAGEMIQALQEAAAGKIRVECPVTLTKRVLREVGAFVDRNPALAVPVLVTLVGSVVLVPVMAALLAWLR
jgi:serine/threonine-protein kinase